MSRQTRSKETLFLISLILCAAELEGRQTDASRVRIGRPSMVRGYRYRNLQDTDEYNQAEVLLTRNMNNTNHTATKIEQTNGLVGNETATNLSASTSQPSPTLRPALSPSFKPTAPECANSDEPASGCGATGEGIAQTCYEGHSCLAGNTICILKIKADLGATLKPGVVGTIGGSLSKLRPPVDTEADAASLNGTEGNSTTNGTSIPDKPPTSLAQELGNSGFTVGFAFLLVVYGIVMGCVIKNLNWC